MKTVHEVSKIAGVSVRTLHHYDDIGLLKPTEVTAAGYRLYDDEALEKLHMILFFRELEFPLKDIKNIISSRSFDKHKALEQQIELLKLQRARIDKLISFAQKIQKTGVDIMDFSAFDKKQIDDYSAQAKALWGKTDAYKEYEAKSKGRTKETEKSIADGLMGIFEEFGKIKHLAPESDEAQSLVAALQRFITENYYNCTKQILSGLGKMYNAGDSMTQNIDAAGGEKTAEFASKAIEIYCAK